MCSTSPLPRLFFIILPHFSNATISHVFLRGRCSGASAEKIRWPVINPFKPPWIIWPNCALRDALYCSHLINKGGWRSWRKSVSHEKWWFCSVYKNQLLKTVGLTKCFEASTVGMVIDVQRDVKSAASKKKPLKWRGWSFKAPRMETVISIDQEKPYLHA